MNDMLSNEELMETKNSSIKFVLAYIKKTYKKQMLAYFLVFIGISSVSLDTYVLRNIIDKISTFNGNYHTIWMMLFLLIGIVCVGLIGWRLAGLYANPLFIQISGFVRHDLIRYLTDHSDTYFSNNRPASMAYRASSTGTTFFDIENTLIWVIFPQVINLSLSILLMMIVNPIMTTTIVVISCIASCILTKMAINSKPLHVKHAELDSRVNSEVNDIISNISLVRSFGIVEKERINMDNIISLEMKSKWTSIKSMEYLRLIHSLFTLVMTSGILITIFYLWEIHKATLGDVVMVTSLGMIIINTTRDLTIAFVDISQHFAKLSDSLETLIKPHDTKEIKVKNNNNNNYIMKGNITFNNVFFGYDKNNLILSDFNLKIKSGQKIGLVGLSGSGKSTILSLIQRLKFVSQGEITIDDVNIEDFSEEEMRKNISIVSQDVQLFYRSIKDNILLGKPNATQEELNNAIEQSRCLEFINKLPNGIDTLVGERGTKLSGGQRQRISIARAFLKNTPILLLDEATSALDNESEKLIQEALLKLEHNKTVIAVAHRLSTLQDFDRIIVMDKGKILQDGTMKILSKEQGFFQKRLLQ